jgi:hypothetical protein
MVLTGTFLSASLALYVDRDYDDSTVANADEIAIESNTAKGWSRWSPWISSWSSARTA